MDWIFWIKLGHTLIFLFASTCIGYVAYRGRMGRTGRHLRAALAIPLAIRARIVDADTGGKPSTRHWVIRYLGYYVSTIPLFLGLIWVAFDPRKQGWHDKMAGTVVVRRKRRGGNPVEFPARPDECNQPARRASLHRWRRRWLKAAPGRAGERRLRRPRPGPTRSAVLAPPIRCHRTANTVSSTPDSV